MSAKFTHQKYTHADPDTISTKDFTQAFSTKIKKVAARYDVVILISGYLWLLLGTPCRFLFGHALSPIFCMNPAQSIFTIEPCPWFRLIYEVHKRFE